VVGGDASYVQRSELFHRTQWGFNARRKATAVNFGIFHPNPRTVYTNVIVETTSKALLPIITGIVPNPLLQMTLSCSLMAVLLVESILLPTYIDQRYVIALQGCRGIISCTMFCGLSTVILNDSNSFLPIVLLVFSFFGVGGFTVYKLLPHIQKNEEQSVSVKFTSMLGL